MTSRIEADPIFCPLIRQRFARVAILLERKTAAVALNES